MYLPGQNCDDEALRDMALTLLPRIDLEQHFAFLPSRAEQRVPVPARLRIGPARRIINADPRLKDGIRTHHAEANSILEAGKNPIITTGTGSGKSLIFMIEALHTILADPNARALVFYPTRALNADQRYKWQELLELANLPPETVAAIDGSVPLGERESLLSRARIVIATPDTFHTWFMGNVDNPYIRQFIANRKLTVLEEVQLYSGAFGTSMMFLMRRLEMAQRWLNPAYKPQTHGRIIATSATIANAPQFMKRLTGQEFTEVGEEHNGANNFSRLIGVSSLLNGSVEDFCRTAHEIYPDKKILVFCDSRYGVEDLANALGDLALPYKSGMASEFQRNVERTIRSGDRKIIVATSALEVGVDLDFDIALNIGLPANVSSALQRIGRVGRHGSGLFLFVDPSWNLPDYGGTMVNYLTSELPPQTLYPDNEFIQMAQAMCLKRERAKLSAALPAKDRARLTYKQGVSWPRGFNEAMNNINKEPNTWPWHYRTLVPPRGSTPHLFHSLRNIGGVSWRISQWDPMRKEYFKNLGTASALSAFVEFQPGAIIRHQSKRYRVRRWTHDRWGTPIIQLDNYDGDNTTAHKIIRLGQANAKEQNLVGNHILSEDVTETQDPGFIGECRFRLHIGIYGFTENYKNQEGYWRTKSVFYQDDEDLAAKDPDNFEGTSVDYGPKRRMLVDTTGIVFHIPHGRFGKDARQVLARALIREYCDMFNIDANDLGYVHERCRFFDRQGRPRDHDNMVIFDRTAGSLRLSQYMPKNMNRLLKRIIRREQTPSARPLTEAEKMHSEYLVETAQFLQKELKKYAIKKPVVLDQQIEEAEKAIEKIDDTLPEGFIRVMAPGSRAEWVRNGVAQRVRIIEPKAYEGIPVYEVLAIDRWAFYSRARARHLEKSDAFGFESDERPHFFKEQGKTLDASRAIPGADLILSSGRWIGYNPETKKYIELDDSGEYEDISIAIEERMQAMREKLKILKERANQREKAGAAKPKTTAPRTTQGPKKPGKKRLKFGLEAKPSVPLTRESMAAKKPAKPPKPRQS